MKAYLQNPNTYSKIYQQYQDNLGAGLIKIDELKKTRDKLTKEKALLSKKLSVADHKLESVKQETKIAFEKEHNIECVHVKEYVIE